MKNAKRNVIVSAFMAIALCMSVVAGATFALFTSNSNVNIAITSGNVEVTATASALKVYSPKAVNETGIADADNAVNENGGRFVNGGTATLTGSELKLDNMTPGDKVNFNIKVENKSTVTVKYRTRIYCGEDNGLYAGLKFSITNGTETYESMAITDWATLTPDVKEVANLDCKVELPVDAGNEYKNKSCKLVYQVEAVQGNAETANDTRYYTLAQFNALTEIPAEVKNVYVDLGNATVKYGKTFTIGKTEIGDAFAYMDVNGNASTGNSTDIKYYNSKAEAEAAEIPEGYRVNCIRPAGGEGADGGPRYTIILETAKKGVNLYLSGKITVIDTPAVNELTMGNGADVSICVPGNSVVIADGLQVNGLCKIWTKHESGFISAVFSHKVPELVMKNCEINGCWLQDGFGADVVVHVGTHGNLEFLPGKSVGLSGACFPDLALHEVPHVYIYNSDNPPEGVVAKRRSYAELVDHMQTVMVQSGLYDALEELDRLLGEWEQARAGNPNRAHQLEHLIREGIAAANLESQVSPETSPDFATLASRIHAALGLLRNTHMEDGMHVFGETPQGKRRAQFIASIVRYDAGQADSLRKRLCTAQGFELETLLAEPGGVDKRLGQSHASLLEKVEKQLVAVCEILMEGTDPEALPACIRSLLGDACLVPDALGGLVSVGRRILGIIERMEATGSLLSAFTGNYVLPGPSGIITRGREDILPTGRNFYALDPRRLPTRAAWRVGQNLARALIAKHLEEEGRYPENVAMFWMCNDMMWADGEGMGQLLYLLGVVPRWLGNGMVEGFDVIPLEELGRPRIDVTVRVSGLLRDSFPAAMHMLDAASPRWMNLWKATLSANIRRNVWRLSKLMIPMRGVPRPFAFFLRSREPIRPGSISPSTRPHGRRRPISRIFFSIGTGTPTARTRSGSNARGRWRPASPQWMLPTTRWSATSTICSTAAATMGRTAA
jgi:hypothetical protein